MQGARSPECEARGDESIGAIAEVSCSARPTVEDGGKGLAGRAERRCFDILHRVRPSGQRRIVQHRKALARAFLNEPTSGGLLLSALLATDRYHEFKSQDYMCPRRRRTDLGGPPIRSLPCAGNLPGSAAERCIGSARSRRDTRGRDLLRLPRLRSEPGLAHEVVQRLAVRHSGFVAILLEPVDDIDWRAHERLVQWFA